MNPYETPRVAPVVTVALEPKTFRLGMAICSVATLAPVYALYVVKMLVAEWGAKSMRSPGTIAADINDTISCGFVAGILFIPGVFFFTRFALHSPATSLQKPGTD